MSNTLSPKVLPLMCVETVDFQGGNTPGKGD
jgi:hypothetical protein